MYSRMFTLRNGDIARGIVTAVITSVFVVFYGAVMQTGFDVFTADWSEIARAAINAAVPAFFGYLGKNFITDSKGRVAGII